MTDQPPVDAPVDAPIDGGSELAFVVSAGAEAVSEALGRALFDQDLPPVWVRVTREGDAASLAAEALDRGARRVIAVGGDGTVNGVVQTLAEAAGRGESVELGVVPCGTANDLARQLDASPHEPQRDLIEAVRFAATGPAVPIDLGCCNGHWFINVATLGPASRTTIDTSRELKEVLGPLAYLINGIASIPEITPFSAVFEHDEGEHEGSWLAAYVGNGGRAGGGFTVAREARLDDGVLRLTLVPARPFLELLPTIAEAATDGGFTTDSVVERRTRRLVVRSQGEPLDVSLDGEPYRAEALTFEVVSRTIGLVADRSRSSVL